MNKQEYFQNLILNEKSTKQKLFYSAILLFSKKGYANVGIRELCRSVGIKESAFYNHYAGKDALFDFIIKYFRAQSEMVVYTEEEIQAIVDTGDVGLFFKQNMQKFITSAGSPLYHTILQIIQMESYVNPRAKEIAAYNLYYLRRDYTQTILKGMMEKGCIICCDIQAVTAAYYYALKGMLDEYLFLTNWEDDVEEINQRIAGHIRFFTEMLTVNRRE